MSIPVQRCKRNKILGDQASPELFYLKRVPGHTRSFTIDDVGTFHTTFNCTGAEEEKDCTVRNIRKVNVRFSVDNSLRLVNESNATTRAASNNVEFFIKGETATTGNNPGGNENPGGGGGDDWQDPDA